VELVERRRRLREGILSEVLTFDRIGVVVGMGRHPGHGKWKSGLCGGWLIGIWVLGNVE